MKWMVRTGNIWNIFVMVFLIRILNILSVRWKWVCIILTSLNYMYIYYAFWKYVQEMRKILKQRTGKKIFWNGLMKWRFLRKRYQAN